ncbi:hypothetical protein A2296_03250 [candidate division CPR3 bacterium RIFOXYB2_FULL_35_8]|nr:MAG: hypothetical protein A2296_03250 [candidate division CPR3 bacterium RIFOXYB2_FULL_35_8]
MWPTSWFLLTLGINLPTIINPALKETVLGYNFSRISGTILGLSFFFTIFFIVLDRMARPRETQNETFKDKILSLLQWVLMPIISLFATALPGLDAHTRLMMNKKIEYIVAPKGISKKK